MPRINDLDAQVSESGALQAYAPVLPTDFVSKSNIPAPAAWNPGGGASQDELMTIYYGPAVPCPTQLRGFRMDVL